MSTPEKENTESTLSPADKEKFQKLFAHGNKQAAIASYDYANEMFSQCVVGDPSNRIYLLAFLSNLKKKFGEKKKKGVMSSLLGGKKNVTSKKAGQTFKSAVESLKSNPWDVGALLTAGGSCEELGYHDVAVEYYRAAVEAEPFDVDANWICAKALREIADYDGAIACVHRILKNKPTDSDALKMRNDLTVEKTIHKSKIATGDTNQVRGAAHGAVLPEDQDAMGNTLTYVQQVERRIKKNPNDVANYLELAQYYYQQADYAQAEKFYAKIVKLSDNAPDMIERFIDSQKQKWHMKVTTLKDEFAESKDPARKSEIKTEFEEAKAEYDKKNMQLAQHRIKYHPSHTGYHYEYGVLLQQKGMIKEAIGEFQMAKPDQSRVGDCALALGQCFQKIEQYKLAMGQYEEAVEKLPPGDSKKKALYLATKLAFAMENYAKAEEYGLELAAVDFSYKDLGELLDKVAQKRQN